MLYDISAEKTTLSLLSCLTFRSIEKCTQFAFYAKVNSKTIAMYGQHHGTVIHTNIIFTFTFICSHACILKIPFDSYAVFDVEQRFNVRYICHLQESFSFSLSLFQSVNLFTLFVHCISSTIGCVPLLIETMSTDNICIGMHCFCFQLAQLKK